MPAGPARDCPLCPRLAECRNTHRAAFPAWHNAPVPSFGALDARLLVVGLAPGLRGANRTGRPFTGDFAGDLLFATLRAHGFARGHYRAPRDDEPWTGDDLHLEDARVTNAVRCLPPQNKPLPAEIRACRPFLAAEIAAMRRLRIIVALGRVAHDAVVATLGAKPRAHPFAHGAQHQLAGGRVLADSFHCSRYNTNTGKLTPAMFDAVFAAVRAALDGGSSVNRGRA
ncbi:MAG: uracil-DNA glycosylase [Alphaproteobacteria bacterium]|nr:uracil-DNA glycosylase [Alphaproteobacteria bacterium]